MEVYREGNLENGADMAPDETEARQIQLGEDNFYQFLTGFFRIPGAMYAVWSEGDRYVSALRLEPWKDGLLLEGLETLPEMRQRGYAKELIRAVQKAICVQDGVKIYSHVSKKNTASLRTHESCGFQIVSDYAVYVDGSVNSRAFTLCCEKKVDKSQRML